MKEHGGRRKRKIKRKKEKERMKEKKNERIKAIQNDIDGHRETNRNAHTHNIFTGKHT